VEPIGKFDKDDSYIMCYGDKHFAQVFGLFLDVVVDRQNTDLCYPVNQHGYLGPELAFDILDASRRVLDDIVQQARRQRGAIEVEFAQDPRTVSNSCSSSGPSCSALTDMTSVEGSIIPSTIVEMNGYRTFRSLQIS
jgi:hypothetical protein